MIERGDLNIVDIKMQAVNNGDILITYNIRGYMGQ